MSLSDYFPYRRPPSAFVEMNVARMGFSDARFDVVFADNVFEQFTEPEAVMHEACRVLRRYGDLKDTTYGRLKAMAAGVGFRAESFMLFGTRLGRALSRLPLLCNSMITDIFWTSGSAYLRKTNGSPEPSPAEQTGSEP